MCWIYNIQEAMPPIFACFSRWVQLGAALELVVVVAVLGSCMAESMSYEGEA